MDSHMAEDKELLLPKQETSFNQSGDNKSYGAFHDKRRHSSTDLYQNTPGHLVFRDHQHLLSQSTTSATTGYTSEDRVFDFSEEQHKTRRDPTLDVVGLSYTVKERPGHWWNGSCFREYRKKKVLQNISMAFKNKELTALVGSSGSGKTSLLDIIAGRAQGEVSGVVSYKHQVCSRDLMKRCSSYVLQADRLLYTLTVREMLTYMAYLKLPGHYKYSQIEKKVESVILDMGLRHVENTRIGGAVVRGVSGGEKRRITIGIELLKDPEILLLDEPTSGLDAFTARHLVTSLAKLAHEGKMVIMSIHQPRSDIFNLLDKLAILTEGRLAFLGRPNQLVPYFTSIGYPCPVNQNPCDVYIDLTSVDRRTPERERTTSKTAQKICNAFMNSTLQATTINHITSGLNHHYSNAMGLDGCNRTYSDASWPRTFSCILNRMNVHLHRDRANLIGRLLFLPFFIPFILMFTGKLKNNQASIQDRLGIVYQSSQVTPYMGLTNAVGLFPLLREVYYRESNDGLYSTFTFLLAYFVHILPYNIISAVLFGSGLYWLVGLNETFEAFGQFLIMSVILVQFGEMMTVSILGIFRDAQLANNTSALLLASAALFASGLVRTIDNMPSVIQWFGYVAIHKYATEIYVYNEFHGLDFDCGPFGTGDVCQETGDDVINQFFPGAGDRIERNWALVCGFFLSIWLVAAVLFKVRGIPVLH